MIVDLAFEEKTLACLLRSNEFCMSGAAHVSSTLFEGAMRQNMAKVAIDFYMARKTHVTDLVFTEEMKKLLRAKVLKPEEISAYAAYYATLKKKDISDWAYVLDGLLTFVKNRMTRALIEDAVKKFLPKSDFDSIEKRFNQVLKVKIGNGVDPVDFYDDAAIEARAVRREMEKKLGIRGISTGIKKLDDALPKGGWLPKELIVIMGGAKRGKTLACIWFANCAAKQGMNAAYFSCEVSKEVIEDRLDAMEAMIAIHELSDHIRDISEHVRITKPKGRLFIYEYPTKTLTVAEVERQLSRLELEKGIEIDMAVCDYAQIMKPARYYDNELKEEATIMEDLRALAGKLGIPILAAAQTNRGGAKKAIVTGTDKGGTFESIQIADGVLGISATDEEMRDGIARIHLSEMRNAPSKVFKIGTKYGFGKFYDRFIEEE